MSQNIFKKAIKLIDAANSEDPNQVTDEYGKMWPKELLYSYRMAEILQRYAPEADSICQLAIRSQHIQRWKSPRNAYPMDRIEIQGQKSRDSIPILLSDYERID